MTYHGKTVNSGRTFVLNDKSQQQKPSIIIIIITTIITVKVIMMFMTGLHQKQFRARRQFYTFE
jgi:hypothetical protein